MTDCLVQELHKQGSGMRNHISRTPFLTAVNESLQDNASRNEPMIFASYCLIGATLVFGGLGYAADRWLATSPWLTLLGLLVGIALGLFGVFTVARSPKGLS